MRTDTIRRSLTATGYRGFSTVGDELTRCLMLGENSFMIKGQTLSFKRKLNSGCWKKKDKSGDMFLFKPIYGVLNWLTWTTCKIRHHVFTIFDTRIRNVKCKNKNILDVLKSLNYISLFEPCKSQKFSSKMH